MPHRDPETGQFLPERDFNDIEVASFNSRVAVAAADLNGTTGTGGESDAFEGLELIDYDDLVDRNESLYLLRAEHRLTAYANSTETADGTVRAQVEISASPSRNLPQGVATGAISSPVIGGNKTDDTIDLIGRPMTAVGHAPFSDGATGVGGGGSAGEDSLVIENIPPEMGSFHPRDELFLNGLFVAWNIDDAAVHLDVTGQHVYGVLAD